MYNNNNLSLIQDSSKQMNMSNKNSKLNLLDNKTIEKVERKSIVSEKEKKNLIVNALIKKKNIGILYLKKKI